jgi:hypothetical protein
MNKKLNINYHMFTLFLADGKKLVGSTCNQILWNKNTSKTPIEFILWVILSTTHLEIKEHH